MHMQCEACKSVICSISVFLVYTLLLLLFGTMQGYSQKKNKGVSKAMIMDTYIVYKNRCIVVVDAVHVL